MDIISQNVYFVNFSLVYKVTLYSISLGLLMSNRLIIGLKVEQRHLLSYFLLFYHYTNFVKILHSFRQN